MRPTRRLRRRSHHRSVRGADRRGSAQHHVTGPALRAGVLSRRRDTRRPGWAPCAPRAGMLVLARTGRFLPRFQMLWPCHDGSLLVSQDSSSASFQNAHASPDPPGTAGQVNDNVPVTVTWRSKVNQCPTGPSAEVAKCVSSLVRGHVGVVNQENIALRVKGNECGVFGSSLKISVKEIHRRAPSDCYTGRYDDRA